jgi:hypothetical protein
MRAKLKFAADLCLQMSVRPGLKNHFVLAGRKQIPSAHEKQHVLKIETSHWADRETISHV